MNIAKDLLQAVNFAADKHRDQRRKGVESSPYINHPIQVAELIARVGGVDNPAVLMAAVLHDTVEDTETTFDEIENAFGLEVRYLVAEVTDEKSLPKAERKKLQVEHTAQISDRAKLIKIADKTCNVRDVTHSPPEDWGAEETRSAILAMTPEYRLSKFQSALPEWAAAKKVGDYLLDFEGTLNFLGGSGLV